MKIIHISTAVLFSLAAAACQPSPGGKGADETEPVQEERVDEPQVRDGIAESQMRDSLATDTASGDTIPDDDR